MKKTDPEEKRRAAIVLCFDEINDHWDTLCALTELLSVCQESSARSVVDAHAIGGAARLLEEKLHKLKAAVEKLERKVIA